MDFTGRTILVTGGTKGVGRGIAAHFLAAGAEVVVCGRSDPDPDTLTHGNRRAHFHGADVRDPDQCRDLVEAAVRETGHLDVLVNNAGGSPWADAADASPRFVEKIVALNLLAPLWCAQAALPHLRSAGAGSIVNIGSVSGTRPSPGTSAYGAAKAGLHSLTTSLAIEWAPEVRVNAVVGGLIRTEQAHLHYGDDDGIARVARTVPLGRLGTPDDIARACAWLASEEASFVTGALLALHGGGERPAFLSAAQA